MTTAFNNPAQTITTLSVSGTAAIIYSKETFPGFSTITAPVTIQTSVLETEQGGKTSTFIGGIVVGQEEFTGVHLVFHSSRHFPASRHLVYGPSVRGVEVEAEAIRQETQTHHHPTHLTIPTLPTAITLRHRTLRINLTSLPRRMDHPVSHQHRRRRPPPHHAQPILSPTIGSGVPRVLPPPVQPTLVR